MRLKSRMIAFGIVVFCLLLASGCATQLNHVGAFSKASADIARCAADAYSAVNETTIERRLADIAADPATTPDVQAFKPLISSTDLGVRISLLKGVEKYADALGDLASADFRKDIDAAAKDLYGALGELQGTYADATGSSLPITNENLAIIATAVDAIGTAIAEKNRRSALRAVVTQADPGIQKAMLLVGDELPEFHSFVLQNLNTVETEMLKAYQKEAPSVSYDVRIERLRSIYRFHQAKEATAQSILDLGAAAKKIADAHALLTKVLSEGRFTSPELVAEIKGLASTAQSFKDFYNKLVKGTEQ